MSRSLRCPCVRHRLEALPVLVLPEDPESGKDRATPLKSSLVNWTLSCSVTFRGGSIIYKAFTIKDSYEEDLIIGIWKTTST